jgi:hypothetical protein
MSVSETSFSDEEEQKVGDSLLSVPSPTASDESPNLIKLYPATLSISNNTHPELVRNWSRYSRFSWTTVVEALRGAVPQKDIKDIKPFVVYYFLRFSKEKRAYDIPDSRNISLAAIKAMVTLSDTAPKDNLEKKFNYFIGYV